MQVGQRLQLRRDALLRARISTCLANNRALKYHPIPHQLHYIIDFLIMNFGDDLVDSFKAFFFLAESVRGHVCDWKQTPKQTC